MEFKKVIEESRQRINAELKALEAQRSEIEDKVTKLNTELEAINAYETVMSGKTHKPTRQPRTLGVKKAILDLLKDNPQGLKRADIVSSLKETHKEQSLSNTLANLKKAGSIDGKDGIYTVK